MSRRNKLGKFDDLLRFKNVLENFDHGTDTLTWEEGKLINPKGKWNSIIFKKDQPNLTNVAFLRTRIEFITKFFDKAEVDEIWITFADPFLKPRKSNRRLTAPVFLDHYKSILSENGTINLKTDSCILYYFSKSVILDRKDIETLYSNTNIYSKALDFPELDIKTFYEQSHLKDGRKIKFLKFKFQAES